MAKVTMYEAIAGLEATARECGCDDCRVVLALVDHVRKLHTILESPDLLEEMADQAHQSWAGWAAWMRAKWHEFHPGGEPFQARWGRQIITSYERLGDDEKKSDRTEAQRYLDVIKRRFGEEIAKLKSIVWEE